MIAELYGKISNSGSNLSDRLEDDLTGNVFGALRYIPFDEAMKPILENAVYPKSIAEIIDTIQAECWDDSIKFWPNEKEGELDVLIEFDNLIIGIEVKYLSDLSSDDGADYSERSTLNLEANEQETSLHQLSRESRIIERIGAKKKKVLIFIADSSSCRSVYEDTIKRNLIDKNVELGYVSWQDLLVELSALNLDNNFHVLIINDLIKLLKKKGFETFRDMSIDNSLFVNPKGYFNFNYDLKKLFDFKIKTDIKGDLYYEFR